MKSRVFLRMRCIETGRLSILSEIDMVDWHEVARIADKKLGGGLLLVSAFNSGRVNVMTIGWGLSGTMWRRPVFMVAVRHSRFTHQAPEEKGEFTVNIPSEPMKKIVDYCGTISGRSTDKLGDLGLKTCPGKSTTVPTIQGCEGYIECRVIGKVEVMSRSVIREVVASIYPSNDFHTLYFGEVLASYTSGQ